MIDPFGAYSCSNETLPLVSLACDELDESINRANRFGVPTGSVEETVSEGIVDFSLLKAFTQNAFGFRIAGFSGDENNPVTDCTEIGNLVGTTRIPAKISLIRATAALFHISAKLKQVGIGSDVLKSQLGNGSTIQLVSDRLIDDASNGTLLGPLRGKVYLDLSNIYEFVLRE